MRFVVALIVSVIALPAVAEEPTPAAVAAKIEAFYAERPSIRAQFVQKVQKPGRRRVQQKSGRVFFARPGKMRWDYVKPEQVFYISDGDVLWSYQPEDGLVTRLSVKSSQLYHQSRYLFGQGDLTRDFELSGAVEADGYALTLVPKESASSFEQLILVADPKTGEIRRSVLIDPYKNRSTIEFERVQYKEIEDKTFQFTPPANATVKDLDKELGQ